MRPAGPAGKRVGSGHPTLPVPRSGWNGSVFDVEADATVLTFNGAAYLLDSARDITKCKRLREALGRLIAARTEGLASEISIQVIDEGCGVPETEMHAIFEPFYESSRTTTAAGNTSLGLALNRSILNRHGGSGSVTYWAEGGFCGVAVSRPWTKPLSR